MRSSFFNAFIGYAVVFILPTLTLASTEDVNSKCSWTIQNQQLVQESVQDTSFLKDEFIACEALLNYAANYTAQLAAKDSKYANILLTTATEKTAAAQTLWILDKHRSEVINSNTSATYNKLLELYKIGMSSYFEKLDSYNQKHIEALESTNPSAVIEWSFFGELYKSEVNLAMDEWISKYYKNETSQLAALKSL